MLLFERNDNSGEKEQNFDINAIILVSATSACLIYSKSVRFVPFFEFCQLKDNLVYYLIRFYDEFPQSP